MRHSAGRKSLPVLLLAFVLLLSAVSTPSYAAPPPPGLDYLLADVSAVSSSDVWTVGGRAGCDPVTLHWTSKRWNAVAAPKPPDTCATLTGVAAVASSDVWAVGGAAPVQGIGIQPLIVHWDGSAWSIVPSPPVATYSNLNEVWAESPTDVWAVGHEQEQVGPAQALTEHWDGNQWAVIESPSVPGADLTVLQAVTTVSSNDAWAVGWSFTLSDPSPYHSVIEHWDGSSWSLVEHPETTLLSDVVGVWADDIWAVGLGGKLHWDGAGWSAFPNSQGSELHAISANGSNDIWAVGSEATADGTRTLTEHWNGGVWKRVRTPSPSDAPALDGVVVVSTRDVWAVGESTWYTPEFSQPTLILHWNGKWRVVPSPNP